MTVVTGVLLALLTFVVGIGALALLGLPWAATACSRLPRTALMRHSLWWGLLVASALVLGINQVTALGSPGAAAVLLTALALSSVLGVLGLRRASPGARRRPSRSFWVLLASSALFAVVLAVRALGPVTNYDTGLYHLGAIQYAEQYAAIPGLANLYFAFGYATTQFPLAAALTWSPLGPEGYRALNAIILLIAIIDLVVRVLRGEKSVGTYVLAAGVAVVAFTMLPLADYWVISPTQDASVFTLTVVAGAYLSEALTRRTWIPAATTSVVVAVTALLLRTTMTAFALTLVAVAIGLVIRRRQTWRAQRIGRATILTTVLSLIALTLSAARDYVLSGWWLYPLSLRPFEVPWRAADPVYVREATLGAARDPSDLWDAASSWTWIPTWWARALSTWEFYAAILLILAAVLLVMIGRPPLRVLAALAPSAIATVFWFTVTPPSFRFAWGPIFTLATITIGWSLWTLSRTSARFNVRAMRDTALITSLVLVITSAITLIVRIDYSSVDQPRTARGVPLAYVVAPVTIPEVVDVTLPSGLRAVTPASGDQCWQVFPLCSPQIPGSVRLRGEDLRAGFLP